MTDDIKISRAMQAEKLFRQGYNCAQAVSGAFADMTSLDFDTIITLSSSFGGGVGGMREVCGAVNAMAIVTGILYGYSSPKNLDEKKAHYKLIQELSAKFKEKNRSIICRELLEQSKNINKTDIADPPHGRTDNYYKKRPCAQIVYDAAQILDEYISEHPIIK